MDSYPDVNEHESRAKRMKLDLSQANIGELCNENGFPSFSTTIADPIEGTSADCDSGYEASTMESMQSSHHTSPHTSESTPTDQLDTSQDSLEDDNGSTVSHLSDLSGLSELSGQDWKPMGGSMAWIQQQMHKGVNPRVLLEELGVVQVPQYVDELTLWKIIIELRRLLAEPPRRNKLRHVNSLDDVVRLLKGAQNIIVLTGAGVSVSCGIPDFRSRDGIYSRLAIDFPNLPDPQAMFDISYFSQDPRPFFKFARDIYPGKFQPSPCHRFIKLLEKHRKLLRNYTQNIDTLEKEANIDRVIECHGSFATATCTRCGHKVSAESIRDTVLAQNIPLCEICHSDNQSTQNDEFKQLVSSGIMKPDIVFFGEGLPDTFHEAMAQDKSKCDLLLVIGSSLKVKPVALIPSSLPAHVPQILINREPLPHCHFDVELMGDCDVIINHLCQLLGHRWEEGIYSPQSLKESPLVPLSDEESRKETEPNCTVDKLELRSEDCKCNISTNTTSSLTESYNNLKEMCTTCHSKQMSINNSSNSSDDFISIKERHMSIDSARDSGIGDNSNFTDLDSEDKTEDRLHGEVASTSQQDWQPKIKISLADRLAKDSYHLIAPARYIFPGAEVFYDPDESVPSADDEDDNDESSNASSTSSSGSSDNESDLDSSQHNLF